MAESTSWFVRPSITTGRKFVAHTILTRSESTSPLLSAFFLPWSALWLSCMLVFGWSASVGHGAIPVNPIFSSHIHSSLFYDHFAVRWHFWAWKTRRFRCDASFFWWEQFHDHRWFLLTEETNLDTFLSIENWVVAATITLRMGGFVVGVQSIMTSYTKSENEKF